MSYPVECYSCGQTFDDPPFNEHGMRQCPECLSYEIHPGHLGKKNPDYTNRDTIRSMYMKTKRLIDHSLLTGGTSESGPRRKSVAGRILEAYGEHEPWEKESVYDRATDSWDAMDQEEKQRYREEYNRLRCGYE